MDTESKRRTWSANEPLGALNAKSVRDLWPRTYNAEGKPDWSHILPYYGDDIVFHDTV